MSDTYRDLIRAVRSEIAKVIVGQKEMSDLMLMTLLSRGHILLEGVPGLAKSLAVETFAKVIGGRFRRFQFTPDKMPGDITGSAIYNEKEKSFVFHPGPVFCNIFLADEINRASPKVQSALLQAMQERSVDTDGFRQEIPAPFMVLATQNPVEQVGTYPLAEAQTDRFMVKYEVRYPEYSEERELLRRKHSDFEIRRADLRQVADTGPIIAMQQEIHHRVRVSQTVMDYILNLCTATRPGQDIPAEYGSYIRLGASPRAAEAVLSLSKSCAFCEGRDAVLFDDVNRCAPHVLRHRILLSPGASARNLTPGGIIRRILERIIPY